MHSESEQENHHKAILDGYDVAEQVGHLIRRAHQRHTAIFQQYSCDSNLTPMQFSVLCSVLDQGPSSLTDIVKRTAIDQATIRGVVKRLKDRGLIKLISDPADNRKVIVCVTADGEQLIQQMIPLAREITDKTLEKLDMSERIALKYLLRKIGGQSQAD
ncbi:MarR family winged helix-turn-helix transcriptional regulator [Marinobacter sp. X15-166B]|uniref:MarR family winged helix-turn-helix transcriptional regulator n=1 Tax=Marinobacter sp. X15-166B TaxID=1897620 RepID=UPI00085C010E|nr:MarR family winged helix-turn-helix transcriptional regulator [Marinobacter sp. X15-166B]OEY67928.1 MarR family transcriptional regulator [Marinobacter sp. X15-166B]